MSLTLDDVRRVVRDELARAEAMRQVAEVLDRQGHGHTWRVDDDATGRSFISCSVCSLRRWVDTSNPDDVRATIAAVTFCG